MERKIILLNGPSSSGKSSLSKALKKLIAEKRSERYEIVSIDDIISTPEEEMIQDLISIIHVFSCRIYGLRKYKKKIEEDFEK